MDNSKPIECAANVLRNGLVLMSGKLCRSNLTGSFIVSSFTDVIRNQKRYVRDSYVFAVEETPCVLSHLNRFPIESFKSCCFNYDGTFFVTHSVSEVGHVTGIF